MCVLQLEEATKEIADEITRPRPSGQEKVQDMQVVLISDEYPVRIRTIRVRRPLATPQLQQLSFRARRSRNS